ncbi:MAG TPA: hypothetical protein VFV87_18725, partial [Pirellulaceae bacterium]|nr:hypothetical protein [Pirellulaceae bacterium]
LGEGLAVAIRLIDEGGDADVMDSQGSGEIMVRNFDLREAEAHLRRNLGSDAFDKPQSLRAVLDGVRQRHKQEQKVYHWDFSESDIR